MKIAIVYTNILAVTENLTLVIPMCIWTNKCESNSV